MWRSFGFGAQGSSQEFVKEYTEGNCRGPGAAPPGKFLIFEVTHPYFLYFLYAKKGVGGP